MMCNEVQPTNAPVPSRIVVIGDVHGDVQRFLHCLISCRVFNEKMEWIAEPRNTVVVQLGDQVDSMHRSVGRETEWEKLCDVEMIHMTDRLDRIARLGGGRVFSLLGNHEMMNVEGDFSYVSEHSRKKLPLGRRRHMFQPGGAVAHILAKRNVILRIGGHLFVHAGILPHHLAMAPDGIHAMNELVRKYLKGVPLTPPETAMFHEVIHGPQSMLWTRLYAEMSANPKLSEAIDMVLRATNCRHIYAGHNTVPSVSLIAAGKVFLVDAGLSRAYEPLNKMQCVQIIDPDTPMEKIQLVQVNTSEHEQAKK